MIYTIRQFKERSYIETDIPKQFFLVTDMEYNLDTNNLKKGVLNGVTGISGSANIILGFMGIARDLIITMDGPETVRLNALSRIMYDNPHYLVSNDMEALFRIWAKSRDGKWGYQGVLQNLYDYSKGWMKHQDSGTYGELYYRWDYGHAPYYDMAEAWEKISPKIMNLSDFVKGYDRVADTIGSYNGKEYYDALSFQQKYDMFEGALQTVCKIYSDEAEWVLKENKLTIPKKTKLVFGIERLESYYKWLNDELTVTEKYVIGHATVEHFEEIKAFIEILDSLDYEYSIIDMKEYVKVREKTYDLDTDAKVDKLLSAYPELRI